MLVFSQERDGFGSALRGGRVRGRGDWTMGSPGPLQEVTYTIPADKCGLVIGKGRKLSLVGLVRKLKVRKTFTLLYINAKGQGSNRCLKTLNMLGF